MDVPQNVTSSTPPRPVTRSTTYKNEVKRLATSYNPEATQMLEQIEADYEMDANHDLGRENDVTNHVNGTLLSLHTQC